MASALALTNHRNESRQGDPGDDAKLVAATAHGDTTALGALFARHARTVFTTAYRLTHSAADAEDVVQDVFVGLPEALSAYEERGQFGPWLQRVTARTALMRMRARERRREEDIEAANLERAGASEPSPLDRAVIRDAISRLPDALRVVFVLFEVEGYSHAEIAALLGISPGASAARVFRAWRLLMAKREDR